MSPKVFIGSSSESYWIAEGVFENLESCSEPTTWKQDIFELSETNISSLESAANEFDFAVFVFSDDDEAKVRGETYSVARDNVIFECGMFIGAMGAKRVIIVQSSEVDFKLPTDLLGWNTAIFSARKDQNAAAMTKTACRRISTVIRKLGPRNKASQDEYVGSICYRLQEGEVQYLLVKTSQGKYIFPKGVVLPAESKEVAAQRFAEDEGGVVGRVEIRKSIAKKYWKASRSLEHDIEFFIVNGSRTREVDEEFRGPSWYSYDEAMQKLSMGRNSKYSEELRSALDWARNELENTNTAVHRLAGAIPYRVSDRNELEILLITSRTNGNWLIPKGHIKKGESAIHTAARECEEEAGVTGLVKPTPMGAYYYERKGAQHEVMGYPMLVQDELPEWPEKEERERRWFAIKEAIDAVKQGDLERLLIRFSDSFDG